MNLLELPRLGTAIYNSGSNNSSQISKVQDGVRLRSVKIGKESITSLLAFRSENSVGVDSVGSGGGLVLFWHEGLDVALLGKSNRFIDVCIRESVSSLCMGNLGLKIDLKCGMP
jgi:hypothetical protein